MASSRTAALVAVLSAALLLLLSFSLLAPSSPRRFLSYTEDNYKVAFASGNFSAAVTRDMPRVVFWHTHPVLSPEFDIGYQRIYLFNDTNKDGLFSLSEAVFTGNLDSYHMAWTVSTVAFGEDSAGTSYAEVLMRGRVSLCMPGDDVSGTPVISDWADVTFDHRIYDRTASFSNALGSFTVNGRTEMPVNVTIKLLKHIDADGFALETYVHGGGSTDVLQLRQAVNPEWSQLTNVSGSLDETSKGSNSTHRFMPTAQPVQDIYLAKGDGTVQAFYHFGTAPVCRAGADAQVVPMNTSYFTDGAGLVLYRAFFISDLVDSVSEQSSLGIDERGFNTSVGDWFQDHLAALMVVCGTISAIVLVTLLAVMYKRYRRSGVDKVDEPPGKAT